MGGIRFLEASTMTGSLRYLRLAVALARYGLARELAFRGEYPFGWYTFEALSQRDYPLLMGLLIFFSTITIIGVLIADMTYGLIDPRAGTSDQESY